MEPLRQSTATVQKVGPFLDPDDGKTPLDGLTLTIQIGKGGGALAPKSDPTVPVHDANGFYNVTFDADDTDTLGMLLIEATDESLHLPVWEKFFVIPQHTYDVLTAAGKTMATAEKQDQIIAAVGGGSGAVPVDHNYGGSDNYRYTTSNGVGIDNAVVNVYLLSDYNAGNRGLDFVKGSTITDVNGRWERPINLDPGSYMLYFYKQQAFGPDVALLVVS